MKDEIDTFRPYPKDYAKQMQQESGIAGLHELAKQKSEEGFHHIVKENELGFLETYHPVGGWDSFRIGGRFLGYFNIKRSGEGRLGERSWCSPDGNREGFADSLRKKDIDVEGTRADAANHASIEYNTVRSALAEAGLSLPATWDDFRKDFKNAEEAERAYNHLPEVEFMREQGLLSSFEDTRERYSVSLEKFLARHSAKLWCRRR